MLRQFAGKDQKGGLTWVLLLGQAVRLPQDNALQPKVHVNLGITMEADGRLLSACQHYRSG